MGELSDRKGFRWSPPIASVEKPTEEEAFRRLARHTLDPIDQRDLHGADFDAVLSLAAIRNPARSHHALQPFALSESAAGVQVQTPHLGKRRGTDEFALFAPLRAR